MEKLVIDTSFWANKKVLITGHTGFKGSWLSIWLGLLGADLYGYALEPSTNDALYLKAGVKKNFSGETFADIRDSGKIADSIKEFKPEIVFHLAAQPLVLRSYIDPIETFSTNVMGTANLLNECLKSKAIKCIINVTTDKCYENKEWIWPYRENEPLGGHDPYSASKACSELVTNSYRLSFFKSQNIGIATARAGNVVGGGDFAKDRLIPDIIRSIQNQSPFNIRNPKATRPWQHVLEPICGYLKLAQNLFEKPMEYSGAYNFGPNAENFINVETVAKLLQKSLAFQIKHTADNKYHEAQNLSLDSSKAKLLLGWNSRWNVEQTMQNIADWYQCYLEKGDLENITYSQINSYMS